MEGTLKYSIITLVIILLLIPSVVFAVEGVLSVDNANQYPGMNKPYSQGYVPEVSGGNVHVVLPLVSGKQMLNDTITVISDLGDPAASPFAFSNMEKTVTLGEHAVNDGKENVSCYLIDLKLPLEAGQVNGRYPLVFRVKYATVDGVSGEQAFTIYVTIRDGKDPNAAAVPETPKEPPPPTPAQSNRG